MRLKIRACILVLQRIMLWLIRDRARRNDLIDHDFSPKRILVLNGAHIGDIVISTSIIPVLRSAYPDAEIGFATGSWSSTVIEGHQDLKHIHVVDHWRMNRSKTTLYRKWRQYRQTRKQALREIRAVDYDLALAIYPWYPDFLDLIWQAGIPFRIGFRHSLLAPFATVLADFPQNLFIHQGARQAEILRPLGIEKKHLLKRRSTLPESSEEAVQEVCELLGVQDIADAKYRIIHMGSGALNRELPVEFWREIATALSKHFTILFTGRGSRECGNISAVIERLDRCVNACDRLSWNGFVAAVRHADTLYGVESMAGHVAAAVDTRSIVVYSAVAGVARWRPEGNLCTVFTNHVPCAPCDSIHGCADMTCLRGIKPADLLKLNGSVY